MEIYDLRLPSIQKVFLPLHICSCNNTTLLAIYFDAVIYFQSQLLLAAQIFKISTMFHGSR